MINPIIMHISYCEQGQTIEKACQLAVMLGFDGIEFRSRNIWENENIENYLDEIYKGVSKAGLKSIILGYPGAALMSPDPEVRRKEIADLINCYRLALERFPMSVCNTFSGALMNASKSVSTDDYEMHGSAIAENEHWQWAAEGFKEIGRFAETVDLKIAFETHMCYLHDIPESAVKLVDMIGCSNVGINLDYGNAMYFANVFPIKHTIDLIGERLYYVHLKNAFTVNRSRLKCGLGDGDINNRELIKLLKESAYTGPLCLEGPRDGDREWFAKQDIGYLRSVLADLS